MGLLKKSSPADSLAVRFAIDEGQMLGRKERRQLELFI
jgi:hypothetical protein